MANNATSNKRFYLPNGISSGILNFPTTPEAHKAAENLLELDREKHHCLFGPGFHNHLSHHILAAYDLGASQELLQKIYENEQKGLLPIDTADRKAGIVEKQDLEVTPQNWTENLGQDKFYACYVTFFTEEIKTHGSSKVLEKYVFSNEANRKGVDMIQRFVSGVLHPMIQVGYGAEFGSDAMIAQGLAQASLHSPLLKSESIYPLEKPSSSGSTPLLHILRQVYDSPTLKPHMPYDPNALVTKRMEDAAKEGRLEEIKKLSSSWFSKQQTEEDLAQKVQELLWMTTLVAVGSGKKRRKPRLDFFLMHTINCTLFLPSLFRVIPTIEDRYKLLQAYLPAVLIVIEMRGRPRVDCELMMSYTEDPKPKASMNQDQLSRAAEKIGQMQLGTGGAHDAFALKERSPWVDMISEVVHAPDSHTIKMMRALYFAAAKYGATPAGKVPGAFLQDGQETLVGSGKLDGTVFVRAAGVLLDTMGWVTRGESAGDWDRSALGWDDAWKSDNV